MVPAGFYREELNRTEWIVPERYENLTSIGVGAYGQVCSANDTKTGEMVAVKKLSRPFQSVIHAKRTYRELQMLRYLKHENVIGLTDVFTTASSLDNFDDVYLVTPLMGADLNSVGKVQQLSDDHVQFLIYQILRGLKYVHSAGIIHRDLKPSNIAVNEDCELKILDFGLARMTDDSMTGYVATRWYRAPEIMLNWMHYNQTVDIWSVGCIMAELLTSKVLFPGGDHTFNIFKADNFSLFVLTILREIDAEFAALPLLNATIISVVARGEDSLAQDVRHLPEELLADPDFFEKYPDIDQLTKIMQLVGKPSPEFLRKITSDSAKNYIRSMPDYEKRPFTDIFIGANPQAIELLEQMLKLDPDQRINSEDAIRHPYLAKYHDPDDEPTGEPFVDSYENAELDVKQWRSLTYDAIQNIRSEDMDTA